MIECIGSELSELERNKGGEELVDKDLVLVCVCVCVVSMFFDWGR